MGVLFLAGDCFLLGSLSCAITGLLAAADSHRLLNAMVMLLILIPIPIPIPMPIPIPIPIPILILMLVVIIVIHTRCGSPVH